MRSFRVTCSPEIKSLKANSRSSSASDKGLFVTHPSHQGFVQRSPLLGRRSPRSPTKMPDRSLRSASRWSHWRLHWPRKRRSSTSRRFTKSDGESQGWSGRTRSGRFLREPSCLSPAAFRRMTLRKIPAIGRDGLATDSEFHAFANRKLHLVLRRQRRDALEARKEAVEPAR